MKIAIIYGTDRSHDISITYLISTWLTDFFSAKGHTVDRFSPNEYEPSDYDLFIIGSAIYGFQLVDEVLTFLTTNKAHFQGKNVASFVVCRLGLLKKRYFKKMQEKIAGNIISSTQFAGSKKRDKKIYDKQSEIEEWAESLLKAV